MSKTAKISEPASELEHLMADLSGLGQLVFVFGDDFAVTHLLGTITPVFDGPADQRWWYVEVGGDAAKWTIHVRVDQVTGVRFERGPYPFPSFPGQEGLGVEFLGPSEDKVFGCGVPDLYRGRRMRPEKLAAWQALRAVRQPRRVQGRSRHPAGPGRLTHRDHQHPRLQFGLQFTAVRHRSTRYARRVGPATRTPMNLSESRTLKLLIRGY